jgi:hypothetical protein
VYLRARKTRAQVVLLTVDGAGRGHVDFGMAISLGCIAASRCLAFFRQAGDDLLLLGKQDLVCLQFLREKVGTSNMRLQFADGLCRLRIGIGVCTFGLAQLARQILHLGVAVGLGGQGRKQWQEFLDHGLDRRFVER